MPHSEYFGYCLQRRKLAHWDREGVARTQFRYSHLLRHLGKIEEANHELEKACTTRDQLEKEHRGQLPQPDPNNPLAIFDQMCSMWAGRFTGKIKQDSTLSLDFTNTPH